MFCTVFEELLLVSAESEAGELRACRLASARSVPLLYLLVVLVYAKGLLFMSYFPVAV